VERGDGLAHGMGKVEMAGPRDCVKRRWLGQGIL